MNAAAPISFWQLALALVFIAAAGGASLIYRLGLGRDLVIGTIRTFAQLFVMGYALVLLFQWNSAPLVLAVFVIMIVFAARIVSTRVNEKDVPYMGATFLSMLAGYCIVAVLVTGLVIQAEPWWKPQYFLPLGGMVVGNSMNALAISLERLFTGLRDRRAAVEMRLCLGADYEEASREIMAEAMRAGMIPSINSMMGVGVVFIPGMATGQILAGADPMLAVRYQIVVMLMLVGSTALSSLLVLKLTRKRCFGVGQNLLLKPKHGANRR